MESYLKRPRGTSQHTINIAKWTHVFSLVAALHVSYLKLQNTMPFPNNPRGDGCPSHQARETGCTKG